MSSAYGLEGLLVPAEADVRRVSVYLHRVRTHHGFGFYSRMRWTRPNGHRIHWRFNRALGGTVPAWN